LRARGDDTLALSLRDPAEAASRTSGCDAVVNLAGEAVAQRWTAASKAKMLESRSERPHRFLTALAGASARPTTYVSASGIGYYGTSEIASFVEGSPPGDDFLARVCVKWEGVAREARALGMRVACVRTALALGKDGGALAKMFPAFNLGLGGVIGNGRQWYSWIHIDDLIGIYMLALDGADGALNASAPNPVTNAEFTRALGAALHRPTFLPTPTFALRAMLGEGADVLLTGQRVLPERTQALGYTFKYPKLDAALESLLA
jgi:uncharacterized protein (TIGR01777 family)